MQFSFSFTFITNSAPLVLLIFKGQKMGVKIEGCKDCKSIKLMPRAKRCARAWLGLRSCDKNHTQSLPSPPQTLSLCTIAVVFHWESKEFPHCFVSSSFCVMWFQYMYNCPLDSNEDWVRRWCFFSPFTQSDVFVFIVKLHALHRDARTVMVLDEYKYRCTSSIWAIQMQA